MNPGNTYTLNKQELSFVQKVQGDLAYTARQYNKRSIEKLALEYGIADKNKVKELTELAIVNRARELAHDSELVPVKVRFDNIVKLYNKQVNLSHRTSQSIMLQQYSTPAPIAYLAGIFAGIDKAEKVFEPSAGNGLLTIASNPQHVIVNEVDAVRRACLQTQGYRQVRNQDATKPFYDLVRTQNAVITNPPFGTLDEAVLYDTFRIKTLDHLMALRALDTMKDTGKAAIIIGSHTHWDEKGRIQSGKNRIFFNYLYRYYQVEDVINIDGKRLYSRQGTGFDVRLILINGRKKEPTGAAPLFNKEMDVVVRSFDDLYDRVMLSMDIPTKTNTAENGYSEWLETISVTRGFEEVSIFSLLDGSLFFKCSTEQFNEKYNTDGNREKLYRKLYSTYQSTDISLLARIVRFFAAITRTEKGLSGTNTTIPVNEILCIDALKGTQGLPDNSVDCIVTSPPYWALRDYHIKGQLGNENCFKEYISRLVAIFTETKRVLKKEGTLWVNISDTYSGSGKGFGSIDKKNPKAGNTKNMITPNRLKIGIPNKSLIGIPQRFSLAMIENGWILRNTIIWKKPNAMPESVKDRFTNDFEYLFFFTRSQKYHFDRQFEDFQNSTIERAKRKASSAKMASGTYKGIDNKKQEKYYGKLLDGQYIGRNKRAVWEISTRPFKEAHFAVFPEDLIETPILAGCPKNGIVLDPFMGSGTTALVATKLNRNFIGFDLNPEYIQIANKRLKNL